MPITSLLYIFFFNFAVYSYLLRSYRTPNVTFFSHSPGLPTHSTYIKWWFKMCCARMKKIGSFRWRNVRFVTALDQIKCLKQITNRDLSIRSQLFLSYHLIYVPCAYLSTWISKGISPNGKIPQKYCHIKGYICN